MAGSRSTSPARSLCLGAGVLSRASRVCPAHRARAEGVWRAGRGREGPAPARGAVYRSPPLCRRQNIFCARPRPCAPLARSSVRTGRRPRPHGAAPITQSRPPAARIRASCASRASRAPAALHPSVGHPMCHFGRVQHPFRARRAEKIGALACDFIAFARAAPVVPHIPPRPSVVPAWPLVHTRLGPRCTVWHCVRRPAGGLNFGLSRGLGFVHNEFRPSRSGISSEAF